MTLIRPAVITIMNMARDTTVITEIAATTAVIHNPEVYPRNQEFEAVQVDGFKNVVFSKHYEVIAEIQRK